MTKRVFSFLMAMLMVFTMVPAEAFAQEDPVPEASESTVYTVGDTQWVRGEDGEPEGETEEGTFWLPVCDEDDEFVTRQGLCDQQAHTHTYACPEDCDKTHVHTEECYRTEYVGCVIHTHDETCATETRYDCGLEAHENHDGCVASESCTVPEHDHEAMACPQQVNFTCTAEHEHSVEAGCAHETVYTCGSQNHTHGDGQCVLVTSYDCGLQIHTHADCATSLVYTDCVEHTEHTESCETKQVLGCGLEAHTCVTEGCAADCAIPEHTHGPECDMESVYYKWELVKDTSDTFAAEKDLPIHFFVTSLEQAQLVSGSYQPFKQTSWGTQNGQNSTAGAYAVEDILSKDERLESKNGIRASMNEDEIIQYVAQWPDAVAADTFRQLDKDYTIGGTDYEKEKYEVQWVTICYRDDDSYNRKCGCNRKYEKGNYPHIHIDGILTKKIVPGTMQLKKEITQAQSVPQTFEFKLHQLELDGSYKPTANRIENSSIDMVATIPAGQVSATIVAKNNIDGDTTNDVSIGFGYYELEELTKTGWENTYNRLGNTSVAHGSIFVNVHTDGSVQYSTNATSGYTTYSAGATVVNAPKPEYTVNYEFYADDATVLAGVKELVSAPTDAKAYSEKDLVTVDKTFTVGRQVENLATGKIYTFQGWDSYGTTKGQNSLSGSTFAMPGSNTTVYGKWTVADLPKATGFINVKKIFNGLPVGTSDLNAQGKTFAYPDDYHVAQKPVVNNVQGEPVSTMMEQSVSLDQSTLTETVGTTTQAIWSGEAYAYTQDGIFLLEEHNYNIPGYTVEVRIETELLENHVTTQTKSTGDGLYMSITLPHESQQSQSKGVLDDAENLGTVTFINTYTKNTGEAVQVLPDLDIHKLDDAGQGIPSGAAFTLYKATKEENVYTKTNEVYRTGTTDAAGHLSFDKLEPGHYVLVETAAPVGYVLSEKAYEFSVVLAKEEEVLKGNNFVMQSTYELESDDEFEEPDAAGLPYHIHVTNAKQNGSIKINKKLFLGETDISNNNNVNGYIEMSLVGPYSDQNGGLIDGIASATVDLEISRTDEGWTASRGGLAYGYYRLTEDMASITGYYWDKNQTQIKVGESAPVERTAEWIHVTGEETVEVGVVNHYHELDEAELWIQKVDANNTTRGLDGAKFGLYTSLNAAQPVYTTHAAEGDGFLHIDHMDEPGTYYLKEITAPNNYHALSADEYWIVVVEAVEENGQTKSYRVASVTASNNNDMGILVDGAAQEMLLIKNNPKVARMTIRKDWVGIPEDDCPAEINVTVTGPNGYSKTVALTKANDYEAKLTGLYLGSYKVAEGYANVNGYTLTGTTYKVDGTATDSVVLDAETDNPTVTVTNSYTENRKDNPTSLTIVKHASGTHEALSGAKFTLHVSGCPKTNCACATVTTDAYGTAVFPHEVLLPGKNHAATTTREYTLVESAAPSGYVPSSETWTVTVQEKDGKTSLALREDGSNIWDHIYDWITGVVGANRAEEPSVYNNGVLYVHNMPQKVKVNVTKVEQFFNNGVEVTDADVIRLLKDNVKIGETYAVSHDYTFTKQDTTTFTLGKTNGMTTSFEVNFGEEYAITEAGGNYNTAVTNSQTGATINGSTTSGTIGYEDLGKDINVTFTNTYRLATYNGHEQEVIENQLTGCLEFTKIFSDNPTTTKPTATFTLYKKDAHGNLQKIADATNDSENKVHFDVHEAGTYVIRETQTPAGYKTAADVTVAVTQIYSTRTVTENNVTTKYITKELVVPTIGTNNQIVNEKNPGSVTFTKEFGKAENNQEIVAEADQKNAQLLMHVHGPIVYKDNVMTAESFNKSQTVELNWQDGKLTGTVANLENGGEYLVHEAVAAIHGYNFKGVTYEGGDTVTIDGIEYRKITIGNTKEHNITVKNTYEKWETGADFDVYKIDSITELPMANVAFTLHTVENCTDCSANGCARNTTDTNGKANFPVSFGADPVTGTAQRKYFYLTETTPVGYEANNIVYRVELSWTDHKESEEAVSNWQIDVNIQFKGDEGWQTPSSFDSTHDQLTVRNVPILRKISIQKTFQGSELQPYLANTNEDGIRQVSFDILDSTGKVVDTLTVGTENNWTDTSENLRLGTYTIQENGADRPRYDLDITYAGTGVIPADNDTATVTLAETSAATVEVTANNQYTAKLHLKEVPDTFQVYKVDEHNHPLNGAEFTLHKVNGAHDCTASECQTETTVNGLATFTVSGQRDVTNPAAVPATVTYYLKETKAPDGYKLPNDMVWEVKVSDDDGEIEVVEHPTEDVFESIVDWIAKLLTDGKHTSKTDETGAVWFAYDNERLTVRNVPKTAELTVKKKVVYTLDGNKPADEVLSELIALAGDLIAEKYQIQATIGEEIHLEEVTATKDAKFDIAYNNTYKVSEVIPEGAAFVSSIDDAEGKVTLDANGNPVSPEVTVTNTYNFKSYNDHSNTYGSLNACVNLQKIDSETNAPLAGATFTLYSGNDVVETDTTDAETDEAAGLIHFDITKPGTYTLKETAAPVGYALSNDEIEIVVTPVIQQVEMEGAPVLVCKLVAQVANNTTQITNTRKSMNITVKKVWDDDNYYARPESVEVELLKLEGETYVSMGKQTLKDKLVGDDWTYTWNNLDPYYTYKVNETPIDQKHGYEVLYSDVAIDYQDAANSSENTAVVTVTNKREQQNIAVTVKKVWKNQPGVNQPTSIQVVLTGTDLTGETRTQTVVLNSANAWSYVWANLPDTFQWSVDEKSVPIGYKKTLSNDGNAWTITNEARVVGAGGIPFTGDDFNLVMWSSVMGISGISVLMFLLLGKKRKTGKYCR
ncbi:MAG: SpaA isopeptide-forming pilin-related protein [Oscillospiraceae bacterium]